MHTLRLPSSHLINLSELNLPCLWAPIPKACHVTLGTALWLSCTKLAANLSCSVSNDKVQCLDYLEAGLKSHINRLKRTHSFSFSPPRLARSAWTNRNTSSPRMSPEEPFCLWSLSQVVQFLQGLDCYQAWIPDLIFTICYSRRAISPMFLTLVASPVLPTPPATGRSMVCSTESGQLSCSLWTVLGNEDLIQRNPLHVPATRQPTIRVLSPLWVFFSTLSAVNNKRVKKGWEQIQDPGSQSTDLGRQKEEEV